MGMLVEGKWTTQWYKADDDGRFVRNPTVFHGAVKADGSSKFTPASGRYHLYVSYACPWAHRTLITRALKGLEDAITASVVDHFMGEDGWRFNPEVEGATEDHVHGATYLREVYLKADANYTGRVTVPVLWDKEDGTIVCNESREIMRMLDHEFNSVASKPDHDLTPAALLETIEQTLDAIYEPINNGVYRSGFATTQGAYQEAVRQTTLVPTNHGE